MKNKIEFTKKSLHESPLYYFAAAIGLLVTTLCCTLSVHLYRDSANVYSFMARALADNNYQDAFHPSIPSLNVLLSWPLTFAGFSPERALLFISCAFYILTIIQLYYLLKIFLPKNLAGTGALLFAVAPKIIRFYCAALIDSGKTFFLVSALYFAYQLIDGKFRSFKHALILGVMLGGLTLSRSEGIGVAMVIVFLVGCYYLHEALRQKKVPHILPLLTTAATCLLLISSRFFIMYLHCGKFIYDKRITDALSGIIDKFTGKDIAAMPAAEKLPSVSWAHLLSDTVRGSYELYLVFAAIGIVLFVFAAKWSKAARLYPDNKIPEFMKWNNFYFVFLFVVIGNILIFKLPSFAAYRYFLLNIPLLMVFTLAGIHLLWCWCSVRPLTKYLLYAVLLVVMIAQLQNGLANATSGKSRKYFKTGRYLATILDSGNNTGRVWFFDKACIEWYYSGMRRAVPIETRAPEIAEFREFEYILCRKDYDKLEYIEKRNDLKEITLPPASTVKLFKRIK